ncbi:hypothetical protein ACLMJK_009371 [Lecanora helva]
MSTMVPTFSSLPLEIRISIYVLAVDYPDLAISFEKASAKHSNAFKEYHHLRPKCTMSPDYSGSFITPTILLLNRQITSEALPILRKKTLHIPSPPPFPRQLCKPLDIIQFVGEITLQRVCKVTLTVDFKTQYARGLNKMIENLVDVWSQENALQLIHIRVINGSMISEREEYRSVIARLQWLEMMVSVTFEGVVPEYKLLKKE